MKKNKPCKTCGGSGRNTVSAKTTKSGEFVLNTVPCPDCRPKPKCTACYDKGYYTQFVGESGSDDFGGEGYVIVPHIQKFPCPKCSQPEHTAHSPLSCSPRPTSGAFKGRRHRENLQKFDWPQCTKQDKKNQTEFIKLAHKAKIFPLPEQIPQPDNGQKIYFSGDDLHWKSQKENCEKGNHTFVCKCDCGEELNIEEFIRSDRAEQRRKTIEWTIDQTWDNGGEKAEYYKKNLLK